MKEKIEIQVETLTTARGVYINIKDLIIVCLKHDKIMNRDQVISELERIEREEAGKRK